MSKILLALLFPLKTVLKLKCLSTEDAIAAKALKKLSSRIN